VHQGKKEHQVHNKVDGDHVEEGLCFFENVALDKGKDENHRWPPTSKGKFIEKRRKKNALDNVCPKKRNKLSENTKDSTDKKELIPNTKGIGADKEPKNTIVLSLNNPVEVCAGVFVIKRKEKVGDNRGEDDVAHFLFIPFSPMKKLEANEALFVNVSRDQVWDKDGKDEKRAHFCHLKVSHLCGNFRGPKNANCQEEDEDVFGKFFVTKRQDCESCEENDPAHVILQGDKDNTTQRQRDEGGDFREVEFSAEKKHGGIVAEKDASVPYLLQAGRFASTFL